MKASGKIISVVLAVVMLFSFTVPAFATEMDIATEICRGTNVTVETSSYPRFIMFDEFAKTWSPMTEDNCADLGFITSVTEEPTLKSKLVSIVDFVKVIFKLFVGVLKGEIKIG